jgi:hypothetical protein
VPGISALNGSLDGGYGALGGPLLAGVDLDQRRPQAQRHDGPGQLEGAVGQRRS